MTKGFNELLKLAKQSRVKTYDDLSDLTYQCENEITGADFECVRQLLKIKMFPVSMNWPRVPNLGQR